MNQIRRGAGADQTTPTTALGGGGLALGPLLDQVSDLVFLVRVEPDEVFTVVDVNQSYLDMLALAGLTRQDVIGHRVEEIIPPENQAFALGKYREALATDSPMHYTETVDLPELRLVADVHLTPIRDVDGSVYLLGSARDVTEQRDTQAALRASERRFAALVERASDIITVMDGAGTLIYASPSAERVLGWSTTDGQANGSAIQQLMHPDDLARLRAGFSGDLDQHEGESFVYRMRHRDGSWVWLEATASNLLDDPAVGGIVVNSRDITERKHAEEALAHQARHDPLTGLPNRALLVDRIGVALADLGRSDHVMAVLFLDLDRFKLVNDGLGHAAGDELLVAVAERLSSVLRPGDSIGRQGGDEFAVLCVGLHRPADALVVADRLSEAMVEPFVLQGTPTFVTTSIGIAIATPDTETTPEELLTRADAAMYQAKDHGRARYELFDAEMQAEASARLETRNALRRAVDEQQFELLYQPELDLKGGDLWMEALLRWKHPELGTVAPDRFIDAAEESGTILPIGRWVLQAACERARRWMIDHPASHPTAIGVNLSPRQLADPQLVAAVDSALRDSGLPPGMLFLEITENAVIDDPEKAVEVLRELKDLGVGIAIDDFGTGYSSLALLQRFPVDALKVDRSFVDGMVDDPNDRAIVAAVIGLARNLGVISVAEGVETEAQLDELRGLGCDFAQGYLWSQPLPVDEIDAWLGSRTES